MADPRNEIYQRLCDAKFDFATMLEGAADAGMLARQRVLIEKLEQDLHAEEQRIAAEDKMLRDDPKVGRIDGAWPAPGRGDESAAPPLPGLPPLPSRTRTALGRLYPQAGGDPERRAEQWRGVLAAVLGGQPMHPAVLAATATEGLPSDGGFVVTAEVAAGVMTRAIEGSVFARIGVPVVPMTSDERVANALDDADETDDAEAAVKADWKEEASEATAQVVKVRQVKLRARKLLVLATASNELAEDASDYVTALEAALARAIGKKFDRALLSGTGAGQPLGVLNAPATIVVTKESGQPAATFKWENATKMWSRLAPGSHEQAWWLIHPTVLPQALSMSLTIGTGGTQPRGVFEAGGPTGYLLLGRPALITSRVKALGSKGDVVLLDPSQLVLGVRRAIAIERSEQALFTSDRLAIRGKFRGDGQPFWDKARTLPESGGTVSPYVVMEAR